MISDGGFPMAVGMTFLVEGNPIPKARPRLGRNGNVYTPRRTTKWETWVGLTAKMRRPQDWDLSGEFAVRLEFQVRTARADVDNLTKSVLDGLNKILWDDDRQVSQCDASRTVGTPAGVVVTVERIA